MSEPNGSGPAGRVLGRITRIQLTRERGFGFIMTPDETEYFLHKKSCVPQRGFDGLQEGDIVSFHWMTTPKGPKAVDARLADQEECRVYIEQAQSAVDTNAEARGNR